MNKNRLLFIHIMKNFDHLDLDGRTLQIFLAVLEQGSVSRAAERLGMTQSAVSHNLERLRNILGDPLFVRAGRGIAATRHAESLRIQVRAILNEMKALRGNGAFDPQTTEALITVAANDYQRDLLLPPLMRQCRSLAPGLRLRVIPSETPSVEILREGHCDLLLTPIPPNGPDVLQRRLFQDEAVCFYDPSCRAAPESLDAYRVAAHITVAFGAEGRNILEIHRVVAENRGRVTITVPNFAGIPPFLAGSDLLATVPKMLSCGLMRRFAWAPLPFPFEPIPIFMVWHRRTHQDPAHVWLRGQLKQAAATLAASGGA